MYLRRLWNMPRIRNLYLTADNWHEVSHVKKSPFYISCAYICLQKKNKSIIFKQIIIIIKYIPARSRCADDIVAAFAVMCTGIGSISLYARTRGLLLYFRAYIIIYCNINPTYFARVLFHDKKKKNHKFSIVVVARRGRNPIWWMSAGDTDGEGKGLNGLCKKKKKSKIRLVYVFFLWGLLHT